MIRFGSNNIFVGYIKQLLHSFNLPLISVHTSNNDEELCEGFKYIKDNIIFQYQEDGSKKILSETYYANKKINNLTAPFYNTSLSYDFETHKYLGKYLRFIRDYNKLNLMSLYNCYANKFIDNFTVVYDSSGDGEVIINDNKKDINYKYCLIPISEKYDYTVAIDCRVPFEIFCIFYDKNYIESTINLEKYTYQKINYASFNKPFLYTKMKDYFMEVAGITTDTPNKNNFLRLNHLKDNLYLIIKLPQDCESTITILEGDYTSYNDQLLITQKGNHSITHSILSNSSRINIEDIDNNNINDIRLVWKNRLLNINSHISYPFSDKLIEYLVGNVIDNQTTISEDVKRMQEGLMAKKYSYSQVLPYGTWTDKLKLFAYENYLRYNKNTYNDSFDILGYGDKDIEKSLDLFRNLNKDMKVRD